MLCPLGLPELCHLKGAINVVLKNEDAYQASVGRRDIGPNLERLFIGGAVRVKSTGPSGSRSS